MILRNERRTKRKNDELVSNKGSMLFIAALALIFFTAFTFFAIQRGQVSPMAHTYYEQAIKAHNAGDYVTAIQYYNSAIDLNPEWYLYNDRGYAYADLGRYEEAVADYNMALASRSHAYTYNNRAYANFRLGNMETVFADYARSIELDPNNPEVFHNRGISNYELGNYEEALADYFRYEDLHGELEAFMIEQIIEIHSYLENQED